MYLRDHWQTYYSRQGRWQIFNMASLQVGYSVLVPPERRSTLHTTLQIRRLWFEEERKLQETEKQGEALPGRGQAETSKSDVPPEWSKTLA